MEKSLKSIFVPKNLKPLETPVLAFAFLGDAVHTLAVRTKLLESGFTKVNNLHKLASKVCSGSGQSKMLDDIVNMLTEEELDIVRRARNTKTHKPPKNLSLEEYKKATALECLLGWLLAKEEFARLEELLNLGLKNLKENVC